VPVIFVVLLFTWARVYPFSVLGVVAGTITETRLIGHTRGRWRKEDRFCPLLRCASHGGLSPRDRGARQDGRYPDADSGKQIQISVVGFSTL
jgi:hypothetical protein